jgi:hypothetical protein
MRGVARIVCATGLAELRCRHQDRHGDQGTNQGSQGSSPHGWNEQAAFLIIGVFGLVPFSRLGVSPSPVLRQC